MKTSRRRFLSVTAATAAVASLTGCGKKDGRTRSWQWRGVLFGAEAEISLHGVDPEKGQQLTQACFEKMRALEGLFSLYQPDSLLCRLNREGEVRAPAPAFVDLLTQAVAYGAKTEGAFDVTVQALWKLYHQHYVKDELLVSPDKMAIAQALALVDDQSVVIEADRVAFQKPGMAVTLNGIAQGYITDQVADFLRAEGMDQTLVHMGEYRALGGHPEKRPWEIGVRSASEFEEILTSLPIENQALAMSGGYGFTFDPKGKRHHLFHPQTGANQPANQTVCVIAPTATMADALSTACAVLVPEQAQDLAGQYGVQLRILKG